MNDCLFEPFYSTFTISLLARLRCPTGRVIRIYSVHFQSQLYLSQSFISGAPRLELGPTVLETAMLPLTPCSYYQRRGQELHLRLVVLQTTPSLFGYLVKKMQRMRQDSNPRSPLSELARFQVECLKPAQPRIHKICVLSISLNHPVHQSQNEVCYHILWLCPFCNQHSPNNVLSKTLLHPEQVKGFEPSTSDLEGRSSTR